MNWKFPKYVIDTPIPWDEMENDFEWFREMKGVPQDSIWHGEGDVFTHTKMVVETLIHLPEFTKLSEQEKHIIFAAAMLHDVEKRSTTTTEVIDGTERIVSPKHAKKAEFTTRRLLYQEITTPFYIREQISKLVRLHGLPVWAIQKTDPNKEVIYASLVVNTKHLSILAKADALGRRCDTQAELFLQIELFKELCLENKCFGKQRIFQSNLSRYLYLNKANSSPDYIPFDDLKFDVYMMCALPGSGKDTFISRNFDLPVLSLDDIRREMRIKPNDKKKNGQVIQLGKEKAKEFMRAKKSYVFNATNITSDMRSKWISLFTEYGGRVTIIYVEVPYKQLILQNNNREYKVPESVIKNMVGKLEIPTPDEAHEIRYVLE